MGDSLCRPRRPAVTTPLVKVEHVSHAFARGRDRALETLRDVSFTVGEGEFVSLVGPSGCGKSTLLRMLAGLLTPTAGTLTIEGAASDHLLGATGYMPQRDMLMPWRTVLDNATVALEFRGRSRQEARAQARAMLPIFGLEGFERAHPVALSGGMRQRVSLLRTVLAGRRILLLDEPFGALDAITRADLHEWLAGLISQLAATVILVTHDLEEAAYLSDRVYVMSARPGRIAASVAIPLPRPRSYDAGGGEAFLALKRELIAALREARRPLQPAVGGWA
jgi:ABC-type nitrate/sulfonate/bicarbonate transport system ATPase subunit